MEYPATATKPDLKAMRRTAASVSAYLFLMGLVMFFMVKFVRETLRRTAVETTGEFIAGAQSDRDIVTEGVRH